MLGKNNKLKKIMIFMIYITVLVCFFDKAYALPNEIINIYVQNAPSGKLYIDIFADMEVEIQENILKDENIENFFVYNDFLELKDVRGKGYITYVSEEKDYVGRKNGDIILHKIEGIKLPNEINIVAINQNGDVQISNTIIVNTNISKINYDYEKNKASVEFSFGGGFIGYIVRLTICVLLETYICYILYALKDISKIAFIKLVSRSLLHLLLSFTYLYSTYLTIVVYATLTFSLVGVDYALMSTLTKNDKQKNLGASILSTAFGFLVCALLYTFF